MRKLFIHVGFAKCGSTSLQAALSNALGIVFPESGNHGGEHLALALRLRGIDDWTRKFFDETWVEEGMAGIMAEIASTTDSVVLSSERLIAMSGAQIATLKELFPNFNIQIIIVQRDIDRYLNSTWRHAVFHHDLAESYDVFLERFKNFNFGSAAHKFSQYFTTHSFDMEADDYVEMVGALIGTSLEIPRANVGVPMELAKLLQHTHTLMGSEEFKKRFDTKTKARLLEVWRGEVAVEIEPMDVCLF